VRCTNCGSEVQTGGRFCTHCGATIGTGTAVPVTGGAFAAPGVAPSSLVYLFGERFVERDTAFTAGEKLPCSEIKVKKKDLTELMFLAAFAALAQDGRLAATMGQKRTLLFKTNAVFVAVSRHDAQDPGSLEGRLLHAITGQAQRDSVEELVWRAVGDSSIDPWGTVIDFVKGYLFQMGLFTEGERSGLVKFVAGRKLVPQCDRISALEAGLPAVQSLLEELRGRNPDLNKQLHEDIKKGINSRYEAPDTDTSSSND